MLRPAVYCLVLVYHMDITWMISMHVVIHPMGCDLAIVFRCRGLSKVRCSEGRLCPSWCAWKVLESVKDLFLEVNPQDNM
jgi:hypothetical protein